MPAAPASPLVAVDANVVMDLGEESESVLDALATIRQRQRSPQIILPLTAKPEVCRRNLMQRSPRPQRSRRSAGLLIPSFPHHSVRVLVECKLLFPSRPSRTLREVSF